MSLSAISAFSAGDPLAAAPVARTDTTKIIVGSDNFPESQPLATIYAETLAAKGIAVDIKSNIGSREVYIRALIDGSIDLLPEYAGAALSYLDKKATVHSPEDVTKALKAALPTGISILTPSPAQGSDSVAVTRATADKFKLKTVANLAPVASEFVLGGSPEWKARKEGVVGLREVYGLEFQSFKALDFAGPLTVSAFVNGQIQAGNLFSTDTAMAANDFVALEDIKNLFPAQNIVPVIATSKLNDNICKDSRCGFCRLNDWLAQYKLN